MGVLEIFLFVLEIFDGSPGDICWVSLTYLMGFLDISDGFPSHI